MGGLGEAAPRSLGAHSIAFVRHRTGLRWWTLGGGVQRNPRARQRAPRFTDFLAGHTPYP